jgi:hypothetical protein
MTTAQHRLANLLMHSAQQAYTIVPGGKAMLARQLMQR